MNSTRRLTPLLLAVLAAAGCTTWRTPVQPPRGALFTQYRAPLTANVADVPVLEKQAPATTLYFHDWIFSGLDFAWDDASIQKAAQEAGLTKIHYADYEVSEILGVYAEFTVRIYGE